MQNVSIFVVDIIKQTNEILKQIKIRLILNHKEGNPVPSSYCLVSVLYTVMTAY